MRKGLKAKGKVPKLTIGQRIDNVIIPGTTGGFYTIIPGIFIVILYSIINVYAYFHGNVEPFAGLRDWFYGGIGLLGIHTARATIQGRTNAKVAVESARQLDEDEEIEVNTDSNGDVKTKKSRNGSDPDVYVTLGGTDSSVGDR